MDNEVLISEVFKRPPIWDRKHKHHANKHVGDKLWKEISGQLKEEEHLLRKKWKYLRDQYAVELGKLRHHSVDDADSICKWRHFQALSFLRESVKPRKSNGHRRSRIRPPSSYTEVIDTIKEEEPMIMSMPGSSSMDSNNGESEGEAGEQYADPCQDTLNTTDLENGRQEASAAFGASVIDMGKLQSLEDDEHVLFFKSLLPHIRKIPESRILSFRNRVMDLVDQYAYQTHNILVSTSNSAHCSSSVSLNTYQT